MAKPDVRDAHALIGEIRRGGVGLYAGTSISVRPSRQRLLRPLERVHVVEVPSALLHDEDAVAQRLTAKGIYPNEAVGWRQCPAGPVEHHSPWGSYSGAALVHDWLYRTRTNCASSTKTITKEEADRVFYELMLEDGVRKSRAWVMWQAVAFLGGKAWSRMKEDDDRLVEANFANA
jgi:Protein of unknown function (DUF1353)